MAVLEPNMKQLENKKIWIVGGSQGIGLALTQRLLKQNNKLVVSARHTTENVELNNLYKTYAKQLVLIDMDVTNKNSIDKAILQAWSAFNGLDIWVYNAGAYQAMTINEWDIEQFELTNQVNYLGAVRMMQPLITLFKDQGHGTWLWNVSLSSDFGLPYGGAYSAPKAALQNLAESIYPELARENIALKVINHGFVKTRLTAKNDFAMLGLMEPEAAAQQICKALSANRFETRFPFNLAFILGLIKRLPKSWALYLTTKMLKDNEPNRK